ncbi:MAG TPA: quinone-dependent dihydroorotate dehydrogenase [Xanthobacteraceae bacterium]|nr:quinone-dependent dihydroorotate dehydrogenase [Xanthobacteraceae bacterium]
MDLYPFARPLLRCLDPETAHRLTIGALKLGLVPGKHEPDDPILAVDAFGLSFPNPVGLAAGFDKNAEVPDAMLALGFGFVEAGTVTPRPQPGNPRKRLFRLEEDEAIVNRLGFNNEGLSAFAARLTQRKRTGRGGIVGANVGKNRDTVDAAADYAAGVTALSPLADYLVVNLSSPNTPGLRALQARDEMERLLLRVLEARGRFAPQQGRLPPLLAKVGPDLGDGELRDIAEVATKLRLDGLIIGNTTIERPATLRSPYRGESGGLSGRPLMERSTACLAAMYRFTGGRMPLIGCGGVASGADAYAKIKAGASLVQLYTALVFQGPALVARIKREIAARLRADGFRSVGEAVGADNELAP